MANKDRELKYYYLLQKNLETGQDSVFHNIEAVIDHTYGLAIENRRAIINGNKFFYLGGVSKVNRGPDIVIRLVFYSARSSYRPNLIDRINLVERSNPKRITEGDKEKNHCVLLLKMDELGTIQDVFAILEKNGRGISERHLRDYFTRFLRIYYESISTDLPRIVAKLDNMPVTNLEDIVNDLSRIKQGKIIVDKEILGSDYLNYSSRINPVQHDIEIIVNAQRNESIKSLVLDIVGKMGTSETKIRRVRLEGANHDNNKVIVDTSFLERKESISCEVDDETGEVKSRDILDKMSELISNLG